MHARVVANAIKIVGKEFSTINYGKCTVVDYKGNTNVTVKFDDPICYVTCELASLNKGRVANPMLPTVYGKGYMGVGCYNGKYDKKSYKLWEAMLKRAYCQKYIKANPSYLNVEVCNEWLNFQNFTKWFYQQKFFDARDDSGKAYQLDKDILVKGNKIYSPETCCFIPSEINTLLGSNRKSRGKYPIGVSKNKNGFLAQVNRQGGNRHVGRFSNPKDAFYAYKEAKESFIKVVAEKWKGRITDKIYKSLLNWEISIDD